LLSHILFFLLLLPQPPGSTLFPYTTLFRSLARFHRTVDELRALRHFDLRRVALEVVAAGCRDRARDDEHSRAGDVSFVDGLLMRSEEHTSELQSLAYLVCRLLLEKKNNTCL